jgi:hypothetical protein
VIWRVGTGFLVGDGKYQLIDATGAVTREWAPYDASDESYLVTTTYLVRDGQLLDRTEAGHRQHHMEDSVNETVILDGLIEDNSEETAGWIAARAK